MGQYNSKYNVENVAPALTPALLEIIQTLRNLVSMIYFLNCHTWGLMFVCVCVKKVIFTKHLGNLSGK